VGSQLPLQRQRQAQRVRLSSSKTDNSSTHKPGSESSTDESATAAGEASLQHTSSQGSGAPEHHNSSAGATGSKSTTAADRAQADEDDTPKGLFAEDSFEDDYGSEEEDEDELEDSDDESDSSGDEDGRDADRVLEVGVSLSGNHGDIRGLQQQQQHGTWYGYSSSIIPLARATPSPMFDHQCLWMH